MTGGNHFDGEAQLGKDGSTNLGKMAEAVRSPSWHIMWIFGIENYRGSITMPKELQHKTGWTKAAFALHQASDRPQTGRSTWTSDPPIVPRCSLGHPTVCLPETKWVRSASGVWLNQSSGLPHIISQQSLVSGLILRSLEREICLISQEYSLD